MAPLRGPGGKRGKPATNGFDGAGSPQGGDSPDQWAQSFTPLADRSRRVLRVERPAVGAARRDERSPTAPSRTTTAALIGMPPVLSAARDSRLLGFIYGGGPANVAVRAPRRQVTYVSRFVPNVPAPGRVRAYDERSQRRMHYCLRLPHGDPSPAGAGVIADLRRPSLRY